MSAEDKELVALFEGLDTPGVSDAMDKLIGQQPFHGLTFQGDRHDCGDKLGFLKATVDMALKREEFSTEFEAFLRQRLGC